MRANLVARRLVGRVLGADLDGAARRGQAEVMRGLVLIEAHGPIAALLHQGHVFGVGHAGGHAGVLLRDRRARGQQGEGEDGGEQSGFVSCAHARPWNRFQGQARGAGRPRGGTAPRRGRSSAGRVSSSRAGRPSGVAARRRSQCRKVVRIRRRAAVSSRISASTAGEQALGGRADVAARGAAAFPHAQERADFPQREPELQRVPHEAEAMGRRFRILAIAGIGARGFRQQAEPLVVADGVAAHAGACGDFADSESAVHEK